MGLEFPNAVGVPLAGQEPTILKHWETGFGLSVGTVTRPTSNPDAGFDCPGAGFDQPPGFNNKGVDYWSTCTQTLFQGILGINIGKTPHTHGAGSGLRNLPRKSILR
jgi:hypothetical protein